MASDDGFCAAVRQLCDRSIILAVNLFFWTYTKRVVLPDGREVNTDRNHRPAITWPCQDRLLVTLDRAEVEGVRALAVPKSRDMGISWCCTWKANHGVIFRRDKNYLFSSRTEEEVYRKGDTGTLFWKVEYNLSPERVPDFLLGRIERSERHIRLCATGGTIDGSRTTPNIGVGRRDNQVYIDEAARVADLRQIKDVLDDSAPSTVYVSTPLAGSAFNRMILDGEVVAHKLGWFEHPEKAHGLYEDLTTPTGFASPWYDLQRFGDAENNIKPRTKRSLAENVDIDLLGSGDLFFDPSVIEEHRTGHAKEPYSRGELLFATKKSSDGSTVATTDPETLAEGDDRLRRREPQAVAFRRNPVGPLLLWIDLEPDPRTGLLRPPQDLRYCISMDPGGGRERANGAMIVWDATSRTQVAEFASASYSPQDQGRLAVAMALWFGGTRPCVIGWESQGVGGAVRAMVTEHLDWQAVYRRKSTNARDRSQTTVVGWQNTAEEATRALTQLQDEMSSGRTVVRSEALLDELTRFIVGEDGMVVLSEHMDLKTNARKAHGDRGMAAAIGVDVLNACAGPGEDALERARLAKARSRDDLMTWAGRERAARRDEMQRARGSRSWRSAI